MNTGCVTYCKPTGDSDTINAKIELHEDDDTCMSVYKDEVESWRKLVKVGEANDVLVDFAWNHDSELHTTTMFSEFWTCDATFGVTKEHRNLFLFAGIDKHIIVFTIFRCYLLKTRAYS